MTEVKFQFRAILVSVRPDGLYRKRLGDGSSRWGVVQRAIQSPGISRRFKARLQRAIAEARLIAQDQYERSITYEDRI